MRETNSNNKIRKECTKPPALRWHTLLAPTTGDQMILLRLCSTGCSVVGLWREKRFFFSKCNVGEASFGDYFSNQHE